jgi:hypothetical protein
VSCFDRFSCVCTVLTIARSAEKLSGKNSIHFGPKYLNYVTLPIIPKE